MEIDRNLLKEFAKVTNDSEPKQETKYLRGTIVKNSGGKYVQLDGSTTATPISEVIDVDEGDRVLVTIENHKATIVGNFSFPPSARKEQEALEKADQAQTSANSATETANAAQQKAQEASDNADTAISQSSIASASAEEAKEQASNAIAAANTASTNASEAKALATQANTNSTEAKNQAAESLASSAEAQAEVTRLQGEVDTAKDNIDQALEDLEAQAGEIAGVKRDYSLKTEVNDAKAQLSTEITEKVGELETKISEDYSLKTENVELEGRLQSQITQNAEGLASQVSKVEQLESDTAQAQEDVAEALAKAGTAQTTATEAQTKANAAKTAADTASANAQAAEEKATIAKNAADAATAAANAADQAVQEAQGDLNEAKQNLANVTSRVDATEADIAEAQADVEAAQTAVNEALADAAEARTVADNAQIAANQAQLDAETAQGVAATAQQKADNAKTAADNATEAAEQAQADVAALTLRVTSAETNITQNSEAIELNASRTEEIGEKVDTVEEDLNSNYYNKTETDAAIKVQSDRITSTVTKVETVEKNAVVSSVEQFYLSTSPTTLAGGSWNTTQPTWTEGKYIWRRTYVTKGDGTTSYQPSQNGVCITGNTGAQGATGATGATGAQGLQGEKGDTGPKGDTGEQGPKGDTGATGANGKSIGTITNYYLATSSSSGVTTSTTGWTTTVQSVSASKKYLWNYEVIKYTDGSVASTTSPCIIGAYGDKGATGEQGPKGDTGATGATGSTGATGATGKGIKSIVEHYQVSTSNSTSPTSWSTTVPTLTATNKYLWNYETITYTDNTTADTAKRVIGVYGDKGATGAKGDTGDQGPKGDTGATGAQGPKGDTGATGAQGPKGDTGATGAQGPKGDKGEGLEFIVGTQTAATGSWTGVANFSTLTDGQQITYWLPYAGSGNATLNLTLYGGATTGAIPCYYGGTTRLTTHYPAGSAIRFIYRENVTIGSSTIAKGFWADANYDSNNYDRVRFNNAITAKTAITAGQIIAGDDSGFFKLEASTAFDITKPILYASSAIAASATGSNNYLAYPSVNLRNTLSGITLTKNKTCYIVGTVENNKFTPNSTLFTTTEPTSEDGLTYIALGLMVTTYQIYLYPEHPIYKYVNGGFKSSGQIAYEAQSTIVDVSDNFNERFDDVNVTIQTAQSTIDQLSNMIAHLITDSDGGSLMTQTSDGWTFNMSSINDNLEAIREAMADMENEHANTDSALNSLVNLVNSVAAKTAYITMSTDDNGDPCIELGKSDNLFKVRITNTAIDFLEGSTKIAYANNRTFYSEKIIVKNELQIGEGPGFVWRTRENGNMGLVYIS